MGKLLKVVLGVLMLIFISRIMISSGLQMTDSVVSGVGGEMAMVSKVIDGDTIELADGRTVRYIGIDTPETVDPRRPIECFGKQAKEENKILVEGKVVILQKDVSETDKYDRLLRYIFLPLENGDSLFVNDYMVREGFADTLTYPPDIKYDHRFLEAQEQAKSNLKGIWSECQ